MYCAVQQAALWEYVLHMCLWRTDSGAESYKYSLLQQAEYSSKLLLGLDWSSLIK